jgi:hypothetical protein
MAVLGPVHNPSGAKGKKQKISWEVYGKGSVSQAPAPYAAE